MRTLLSYSAAGLLALALTGCSSSKPVETATAPQENGAKTLAEGDPAPAFDLKDAKGASVKLADFKGRVVLLNFWATWCVPCKAEIPWFQEFDKTYKDRGLSVVGVSMDEDGWKAVNPYVEERKIAYTMLLGNDELAAAYGDIYSLPTTFLIDGEGKVASIHRGLVSKDTYRKGIEDLLEAKHGEVRAPGGARELAYFRAPRIGAK
jgi:cytochrome c biogenesis protein CcmG/thiol:disulfide interchange protein DsbE